MIKTGENEFHVYKALVCLKNLCSDWQIADMLFDESFFERDYGQGVNIFTILKEVLEQDKPQLVKVIAQLISKMVQAPKDIRLWLKFDSQNLSVNSAGVSNSIRIHGNPSRMPPDKGIYRSWGARFDSGDALEIARGFEHKGNRNRDGPQLEWSISFWTVLSVKN